MPSDEINQRRVRILPDKLKQHEFEFAEESKLNDVLVLCLKAATTQLASGQIQRVVRMETTPRFVFVPSHCTHGTRNCSISLSPSTR